MPANKFTKGLYKSGTIKSEKAAIANRDPARARAAMQAVAREGTTRGAPMKMAKPTAMPKAPQVIRTTTMMKPTPSTKKK